MEGSAEATWGLDAQMPSVNTTRRATIRRVIGTALVFTRGICVWVGGTSDTLQELTPTSRGG